MTSLLVKFPPHADESPSGYLKRLANENGLGSWHGLVRTAGLNPSINAIWKNTKELTSVFGLDSSWLSTLFDPAKSDSNLNDPFFHRMEREPICPECIAESEYLRHAWANCFVTACSSHKCRLTDECTECHTPLDGYRHGIAICNCGFDLRYQKTQKVSPAEIWLSARLAGNMRPVDTISELGNESDYSLLSKLIFQLVVRFDVSVKTKAGKVSRPKTLAESIVFLKPFLYLMEDFRPRFHDHVLHRFDRGLSTGSSLSSRLGAWYTNLNRLCQKPTRFATVWEVFSNAAFQQFDGILRGQRSLAPSEGVVRQYLSISEAAKEICMTVPALQRGIDQGSVKTHLNRQGVNYQVTMISRPEAVRIKAIRAEWISETSAAAALGISQSVLQNLVRAGLVAVDTRWGLQFGKSGPIFSRDIPKLVDRLSGELAEKDAGEMLGFAELTARRTVDVKALTSLYLAIFDGKIRPIAKFPGVGISGFRFAASDVKKHLGSASLAAGLTLLQLERATGLKYESLSQWVSLGFLEADWVTLNGKNASVVSWTSFAQFQRDWIPVSHLAQAIGSQASAVTGRLEKQGVAIVGRTETKDGVRRGGLVRLRDLATLLKLGSA